MLLDKWHKVFTYAYIDFYRLRLLIKLFEKGYHKQMNTI